MSWSSAWKWVCTIALIAAAGSYLTREVATIILVLAAACGILFLFSLFFVGSLEAINRGIELLQSRLRALDAPARAFPATPRSFASGAGSGSFLVATHTREAARRSSPEAAICVESAPRVCRAKE